MKSRGAIIAFDALSHSVRLKIFKKLVKKGDKGIAASVFCEKMEIPPATLSFHMSKLINGDLIWSKKKGRNVIYFANHQCARDLIEFLMEKCCIESEKI